MKKRLLNFYMMTSLLLYSQLLQASYVQVAEQKTTVSSNNISTINFASPTRTGNFLACWVYYNSGTLSVSGITDTASNTYQVAAGPTTGTNTLTSWRQEIWYAYNITGASNLNVTATFSGTFNAIKAISCHEYSGVVSLSDPKDVTASSAHTSTANASTGSATTTQANDLIFAAGIFSGTAPYNGSGLAQKSNLGGNVAEDKIAVSAGATSASFTNTSQDSITQMVAFKTTSQFSKTISLIQSVKAANTVTTVAATLNGVTAGNFIVAAIVAPNLISILSISDGTNSYTLTPNSPSTNASSAGRAWIAYRPNVSGGNTTITVTFSGTTQSNLWLGEFSGVAKVSPLDIDAAHAATTSSTNLNDPSITTSLNGELLVGVVSPANNIISANVPWVGTGDIQTGDDWEYYVQSSKGTATVSWTQDTASQWAAMIAAFKPATRPNPATINSPVHY